MKTILTKLFTMLMLMMFSMGAYADVKVLYGEKGAEKFEGTGGTIEVKQEDSKNDKTKVTITLIVTPADGYKMEKNGIEAYAVISPDGASTRAPEISGDALNFTCNDYTSDTKKRTYTVDIDSKLALWVKSATFEKKSGGSKWNGDATGGYSGVYYICSGKDRNSNASPNTSYYLCPTEKWYFFVSPNDCVAYNSSDPTTDNGKPFMTTYQCLNSSLPNPYNPNNAVWIVEKQPSGSYYIRRASDGKYLTHNESLVTTGTVNVGANRMRVHLEETASDDALFSITAYSSGGVNISADNAPNENMYLNVNKANKNSLTGKDNAENGTALGGIIGVWKESKDYSVWFLEKATVDPPTFTNNYSANNTFTITAESGATIYYTTDGTTPTTSTTTTGTTSVNVTQTVDMTVIKAIAKGANDAFPSLVATYDIPKCERPVITVSGGNVTITCATAGATIYYTTNGDPATPSSPLHSSTLPVTFPKGSITTIRAIAISPGYVKSIEAQFLPPTEVSSSSAITDMSGNYILADIFTQTGSIGTSDDPFTGTIDGNMVTRTLSYPLVAYAQDATIKNVIVKGAISGSGNVGAIAANAMGDTRIYNCGVLATSVLREDPDDEKKITGFSGSSVSGGGYVGGIVGLLDGSSRVINCFSYANVSGGSERGGIVGHNNYASKADDINHIKTMIMNCMFYGDITGGGAPIYGGENIDNLKENDGLNTFNFYCYETLQGGIPTDMYHCALAVEQKYLTRFEFYRQLLNSNKKLAAIYATGSADNAGGKMAKWVLETADRTIDNPLPFPVLKTQGYYPSIINIDAKNAPDSVSVGRNKGGKLGTKTLNVTISAPGGWTNAPSGAKLLDENGNEITTSRNITLTCTDKDFDRFNFNYDKVQLPYYNDYGTMNYTGNKVVTGWKITAISNGTDGTYTAADQWNGYNFADRKCTNKDKYGTNGSNRVFSQGAYYDVPYGVTAIEIEPYWGKAAYLADPNYDVVYAADYARQDVSLLGTQVDGSTKFNGQDVKSTVSSALGTITSPGSTVYDNAIVLVGNFHQNIIDKIAPFNGSTPFTIMSVDEDKDNEPDYSLIYHDNNRSAVCPIRFDFLNIPGTAQAQKPNATATVLNASVFNPKKWFEITNTCLIYFSQFEYENVTKSGDAPVILLGGVYDQFVSTKIGSPATTTYLHVGGNAWFKDFGNGTHSDGSGSTTHVPISVTGGDFDGFYLTSTYTASTTIKNDDAECYISGGHFKEAAGAGLEKIGGNVHWQIYNADIDNFYGGGVTAPSTIQGDVTVDIFNSYVTNYCGGPKFGDMQSGKKVTTNATGCEFNQFYGAGYGGTSVKRQKYTDHTTYDFTTLQNRYATSSGDRGKYFNGSGTEVRSHDNVLYGYKGPGVATDFDYEFFVWTSGKVGARFFVKFSSFSLAQCNDVESNLTNCTIKGNFYGGGKLGKVAGTVTSVLDDCKVKGNAFGAGFSASFEDVKVRKAGFASNADIPKFNALSGMFESGKLSGTDLYTWKNAAEADVTLTEGGSGTNSTDLLYTDVELTDENLGTVAGNVNLTIKGNSVIGTEGVSTTGNVYGGGDESFVTGSGNKITVTLAGNTQVLGNVFGGGNEGLVEGSATVNIQDTVDD